MKRAVRIALLALLAGRNLGLAATLPSPDEAWIELRTANFTLFSNASEKATSKVGDDLERLRATLAKILPGLQLTSPNPTVIYVFRNSAAFAPYQELHGGKPVGVGGYFLSRALGNYVAIDGDPRGDQKAIIYHEYIHYVLRNSYVWLPLWLNEGLAEYYSTFDVARGDAKIGLPHEAHIAFLRTHPLGPVRQLMAVDDRSPAYNESSRRGAFYAQSWALTHYLMLGNDTRHGQLIDYLRRLRVGEPAEAAFAASFGVAPEVFDRELVDYLRGYTLKYLRIPIPPLAAAAGMVRSMVRWEVLYRLGDLLSNLGEERAADATEHLRAALQAKPDCGPALASLARLAEQAGRADEARALLARAADLSPDDFAVQYSYAHQLLEHPDSGSTARAREALRRATRLRPDFAEAWAELGYNLISDDRLGSEGLAALETAHRLLPSRRDVAHNLAVAYARSDRLQEAQALIDGALAGEPEYAASAKEAILHQEYRHAQELLDKQRLDEALPLLRSIQKRTARPDFSAALARQVDEIERVTAHNLFVDRYNQAVERVNRGDFAGAESILEPLIQSAKDATDSQHAKDLLARLQVERKKWRE
jgi:tetratricopeptide (TPR) repeat protein